MPSPKRMRGPAPGDAYLDLAEAVERGAIAGDGDLEPVGLRESYTIGLGSWESMIEELLGQLAADAGTARQALVQLRVPAQLLDAWDQGATVGTRASAKWFAAGRPDAFGRIALAPSVRAFRGDHYLDLAEVGTRFGVAGDGALDPARLRRRYTIARAPWLRMIADLLGQVVADAGSVERASPVLGVPLRSLAAWVRWLVSRGSVDAARSRWPVATAGDDLESAAALDLIEAVERGAVDGDNAIDAPAVRDHYTVQFDTWERMRADLLGQIVTDAGSLRQAAKVIDVPRATLGAWTKRAREGRR